MLDLYTQGVHSWNIDSESTPGATHLVTRRDPRACAPEAPDVWTCTCKGYRYGSRKKLNHHCRHIRQVIHTLVDNYRKSLEGNTI